MLIKEIILMPPVSQALDIRNWYNHALTMLRYHQVVKKLPLPAINSRVFFDPESKIYKIFVLDDNQFPIFYISLSKMHDGLKVSSVHRSPKAEAGLGLKIYPVLVDYFDLPIYSDSTQTEASRRGIWQRLISAYPDRIVAYDQRSKQEIPLNSQVLTNLYQTLPDHERDDVESPVRSETMLLKFKPGK